MHKCHSQNHSVGYFLCVSMYVDLVLMCVCGDLFEIAKCAWGFYGFLNAATALAALSFTHRASHTTEKCNVRRLWMGISSYILKPITHIEPRWVQLKLKFSSHTHKHLGQFENIISVSHSSCVTFPTQIRKNLSKRHHTVGRRRRRENAWPLLYAPLSLSFSLRASFECF